MSDIEQDVMDDAPGLHLFAKVGLSLESVAAELKKANDREQRRLAGLPINYPLQQYSNPGAAVTDIKDFGGPQPGRVWMVRQLTAFATPVAANAATVSWYVGQVMPGNAAGQLPINMKRWEFTTLPGEQNFNANVLVIRNGEHLIAGLTGIPASSAITLNVVINDQPAWAAQFGVAAED